MNIEQALDSIRSSIQSANQGEVAAKIEYFDKVECRLARKRQQVADILHELHLLENEAFSTYSEIVLYSRLDIDAIRNAREWIRMKSNKVDNSGYKVDRRKKYAEATAFDWITSNLRNLTRIDDFEIVDIVDHNFGEGYNIEFNYLDRKWGIFVPDIKKVTIEAYKDKGPSCFQLAVTRSDRKCDAEFVSFFTVVGRTFIESKLGDIIQQASRELMDGVLVCAGDNS